MEGGGQARGPGPDPGGGGPGGPDVIVAAAGAEGDPGPAAGARRPTRVTTEKADGGAGSRPPGRPTGSSSSSAAGAPCSATPRCPAAVTRSRRFRSRLSSPAGTSRAASGPSRTTGAGGSSSFRRSSTVGSAVGARGWGTRSLRWRSWKRRSRP